MIRPGPTAILGLGLCLVPALAMAVWPGMGLWLALALLAWLAVTAVAAARLPGPQHLLLETEIDGSARLGQPVSVRLTLTNLHFQRLRLDAALVHSAPMETEGVRLHATLAPGERLERGLDLTPQQRGALDCGVLQASLRGGLGWLERRVDLPLDAQLQVHPATLTSRLLAALYPDALPDRHQPTTERILFAGLRPFVPGDDARDLSWAASARSRTPMVRTWEGPREGPVLLVLDRGAGMSVAMDDGSSRLDRAVAVATGLLRALERAGRTVTVAAWSHGMDLWDSSGAVGAGQALAALQPAEQPWDPTDLGTALRPRLAPATTIVVLTEPDGAPEALAASLSLLVPRASVRVLLVGEPSLGRAATQPVRNLEQAYRCGAALALESERRQAAALWRRGGATVVDASARRARSPL